MAEPVANPLTLIMTIKSPADFQKLKALIQGLQSMPPEQNPVATALTRIGTVHFARFVFLGETQLAVITAYDGRFDEYIFAFVREIGTVFDQILVHMEGAPPLPVSENRDAFLAYVEKNDLKCVPPFYSAYPKLTAAQIVAYQQRLDGDR